MGPLANASVFGSGLERVRARLLTALHLGQAKPGSRAPSIRRMAALEPTTVGIMHGSSFSGDGGAMLRAIADSYERRLQQSMANA